MLFPLFRKFWKKLLFVVTALKRWMQSNFEVIAITVGLKIDKLSKKCEMRSNNQNIDWQWNASVVDWDCSTLCVAGQLYQKKQTLNSQGDPYSQRDCDLSRCFNRREPKSKWEVKVLFECSQQWWGERIWKKRGTEMSQGLEDCLPYREEQCRIS